MLHCRQVFHNHCSSIIIVTCSFWDHKIPLILCVYNLFPYMQFPYWSDLIFVIQNYFMILNHKDLKLYINAQLRLGHFVVSLSEVNTVIFWVNILCPKLSLVLSEVNHIVNNILNLLLLRISTSEWKIEFSDLNSSLTCLISTN